MFQEFTGAEYLKIDIANSFGHDKLDWDDRIAWFDKHEQQLPFMLKQAEEPALAFAGLEAWNKYVAGEPSGYPISLDATTSGLQLLAIFTGCRKSAMCCNVIDTGHRVDGYTHMYEAMKTMDEIANRIADRISAEIPKASSIDRDKVKQAVMCSLYGSKAEPKKAFGEGKMLDLFYKTMRQEAPGAWELNELFLDLPDGKTTEYITTLPDGFTSHVKVEGKELEMFHFAGAPFEHYNTIEIAASKGYRALGANTTHSVDAFVVREMSARCNYDPEEVANARALCDGGKFGTATDANYQMVEKLWELYQLSGMLSIRIIKYLDFKSIQLVNVYEIIQLLDTLPAKPFKVVSVHD